jgi:hypothetical protein
MQVTISKDLLDLLACPVCKADVTLDADPTTLRCTGCGRSFPIHDGVPDMMPTDAEDETISE